MAKMLVDLDIDTIAEATQLEIDAGTDPQTIMKALTDGMNEVGSRYEEGEYFLTELVLAGETMKEAFAVLKPHLSAEEKGGKKPVVIATVKGDNHDIGKNILGTMLMSAGFEVVDLGIDVSKEDIVESVKKHGAKVVALSCLLTMTIKEITLVNDALKDAGLRDTVKLIVGGAPLNMQLAKELGADDYGADAIDGVKRIGALLEG
ncbi:MAG: cobalamin-dependent protein [Candidatus Thorarchaeota archaeon]|nr:cobalamin-dependent protein [Candidatus Thorarchaeota archaeon]